MPQPVGVMASPVVVDDPRPVPDGSGLEGLLATAALGADEAFGCLPDDL